MKESGKNNPFGSCLVLVIAAVLLLLLFVDRSKGRPDPDRMWSVPAGPGTTTEGAAPETREAGGIVDHLVG